MYSQPSQFQAIRILAHTRRKFISLFVLCFGFTLAVHTLNIVFENNGLGVQELDREQSHKLHQDNPLTYDEIRVKSVWTYRCKQNVGCVRELRQENAETIEPQVCWLNCGLHGSLWPYPTGKVTTVCILKLFLSVV